MTACSWGIAEQKQGPLQSRTVCSVVKGGLSRRVLSWTMATSCSRPSSSIHSMFPVLPVSGREGRGIWYWNISRPSKPLGGSCGYSLTVCCDHLWIFSGRSDGEVGDTITFNDYFVFISFLFFFFNLDWPVFTHVMAAALDNTPDYQLGWAERGCNIAVLKCEDFCPWGLLIFPRTLLWDIRPQWDVCEADHCF